MNIANFIKSNRELAELPFLITYQTILILKENGFLKEGDTDVGAFQPEPPRQASRRLLCSGENHIGSRSIYTPAAVDEYGNVTSRAIVDVPKGCCFTVSVEYVNGTVDDPTVTPTPLISVIDGSLTIDRKA